MKRTAVITGVSSGIGLEIARELSKNYKVIGLCRREFALLGVQILRCDVTDEESVRKAFEEIESIDLLVNCAGSGISGAIEFCSLKDAKAQFDVNYFGTFLCCKHAMEKLRRTRGKIINVSSVGSFLALPYQGFYSASKTALNTLSEVLAMETKRFGISVCALLLGDIKTGFTAVRRKNEEGNDLYGKSIVRAVEKMEKDEQNGMPPSKIGKAVAKLAKKKRLPIYRTVGFQYKLIIFLNKLLPKRWVLFILRKMYG